MPGCLRSSPSESGRSACLAGVTSVGPAAELAGASRAGKAVAALCFTIVLAAVGYGLYLIVATGHK